MHARRKDGMARRAMAVAMSAALICLTALPGCAHGSRGSIGDYAAPVSIERKAMPSGIAGTDLQIEGLRDHYVDTSAAETATVMVYLCGSDLEAIEQDASDDVREMVDAADSDEVTVVLQTGGTTSWDFSDEADADQVQRWEVEEDEVELVQSMDQSSMVDPDNLSDFISWSTETYPADRYLLVLWDHGGGTLGGYGWDQNFPDDDSMSLADIASAIDESGVTFDLVGFDACLMGTIETAYALEPYADYLMASEESESGYGWEWTSLVDTLVSDPSVDTRTLCQEAIDSYDDFYVEWGWGDETTLSLVELREVPYVAELYGDYLDSLMAAIQEDNGLFSDVSRARTTACSYGEGDFDQVDLYDLIERIDAEGTDELLAAIDSCVKYRTGSAPAGSHGLAVYFPYEWSSEYADTRDMLVEISYDDPLDFYDYFLGVMEGSTEGSDADGFGSWMDNLPDFDYGELPGELEATASGDEYVVAMTEPLWDAFSSFRVSLMLEDEDGWTLLGSDNVFDYDDNENIVMYFDGEWVAIDGVTVPYECNEPVEGDDGEYTFSGTVAARLNGTDDIVISIHWEDRDGEQVGVIDGYRLQSEIDNHLSGQGFWQLSEGDEIVPLFEHYDEEGNLTGTVEGEKIVVGSGELLAEDQELASGDVRMWGTLTTVYGDEISTNIVSF